jgi:protein-disulfide isomerase
MVTPDTPFRGPPDADLFIVEFSDYECPFCQQSNVILEEVLRKHGKRIRMYHRQFPLDKTCFRQMQRQMHPHACFAAGAAICAQAQGKFWEMNDGLFRLGDGIGEATILGLARKLGLASTAFEACLRSPDTDRRIQADLAAGIANKVNGTPTYFMGGPQIEQFKPPGVSVDFFDELFQKLDEQKRRPAGGAVPAGKP